MAAMKNRAAIKNMIKTSEAVSDAVSWLCAVALISVILVVGLKETYNTSPSLSNEPAMMRGEQFLDKPCEEIYVVGEGETLHTISDKCGDPFIVERNPHIHDPDDIFPGLVIRISPFKSRKLV